MTGFNNAIFVVGESFNKTKGTLCFKDYYNNKEHEYVVNETNVIGNFYAGCPTLLYQSPAEKNIRAIIV